MESVLDEKKRRLLALLMKEKGIDPAKAPVVPLPRRPGQTFPLSFAQERLWVLDQLEPGNVAYNLPTPLRLSGRLRPEVLARVFAEIVRRHEALRTAFGVAGDGRPVQIVNPPAPVPVPLADLSGLSPEAREPELSRLAVEEGSRPFDLARGPVLRVRLVRLGEEEHALFLTLHHIASDGWSTGVLVSEVVALYDAFSHGRPSPLPELPVQYADFAAWQRQALDGEGFERALAWWRERLAGAPVLELPTDHPRPAVQGLQGASVVRRMPPALAADLKALARSEGATLFMAVTAAFQALLARLSGQRDLTVGTPVANRHKTEIEGLIGFFVNTLVLRTGLSGDPPFRELLARVRGVAVGAFQHGEVPFSRIVEEVKPERSLSHTPLFQVMCALANTPSSTLEVPGLRFAPLDAPVDSAMFDLNLTVTESPAGFGAMLEFRTDLFEKTTALRLLGAYETVLAAAVAEPERRLSDLPILTPPERQALIVEWNDPAGPEAGWTLDEALAASAERNADWPALVFEGKSFTFREVEERARELAARLRGMGVGPGSRVGLPAERSPETLVRLFAVLKAGAAYVPLDPAYPAERLAFMLEDSGAAVVFEKDCRDCKDCRDGKDGREAFPEDLAYVIYTSGSTGKPKGVGMTRGSAANLLAWQARHPRLSRPARTLQFTSLSFDVSFQEIVSTWITGGTLVLVSEETRRDFFALLDLIDREGVERLFLPFVALRQLAEAAEARGQGGESLRDVVTAGEQLQATRALRTWFGRLPECRLHNQYGPTESHVVVTALTLADDPASWPALPSIGRPLARAAIRLLDPALQPVPQGVPGEIHIGGPALARGYLDRPDLTAERFVPDPFGDAGSRLYRTGDLGRWLSDGTVEYLGRRDGQVKVRGVRVETGEVETALDRHPGVRQAVVVPAPEPGSPGALRLVAFYVPVPEAEPGAAELRDFLAARLPAAYVPSVFVSLEKLPTTPSGKVDRKALATGDGFAVGSSVSGYVAPRTQTEELLAGVWGSLLGIERVGVRDNFFELGGHSLLATRLVSRVREVFRLEIPQRALFEAPTVGELARVIEASSEGPAAALLAPVERVPGDGPFPLSFSQERLWLLEQIEPGNAAYNMAAALRFTGDLRPDLLAAVFAEIVRRHATLRTAYGPDGGAPVQTVHPPGPFHLPVIDLSALPSREAEARRLAGEEALRPFDLARGPVLRASLLRLEEGDHVLLFNMHHISSDGWSTGILVREVMALYGGTPLPELPVRYVDYAAWQRRVLRGEVLEAALAYWRERLAGVPVLELPTDRPRTEIPAPEGASEPFLVPAEVSEALKALGRRHGATLFMTLAAAFEAFLSRYTGQTDFGLGTPVAGRDRVELEDLIGFFVNTLVLRARLEGDPPFTEILARVREASLGAFAHQEMPFERLVEELNPERSLAHTPLFQVMLILQNAPAAALEIPGLTAVPFEAEGLAAKFDLTLSLGEAEEGLTGTLEYRTALFDAATVRSLLVHFGALLAGIAADPGIRLSELPFLGPTDRRAKAPRERPGPAPFEAPRTEAEARLAGLWESLLGVPAAGVHDNFFDLGGHSLLATQLISRIREAFGVEIPLRALFEAPTVARLAPRIAAGGDARVLPPVVPVPRDGLLPLSFAQERLWVIDQLEPGTIAYNLPAGLRLVGRLQPDVLARAFSEIARRHESLRTTFAVPEAGGAAVQVIAPPSPVDLPLADLSGLPEGAREAEIRRLAWEEGARPFDLVRGPVWRALLARLGEDDHALLVTMHHIASDGWSMGVLVQEIVAIYGALSQGLPVPLPELPVQYADYAVWQRQVFGGGALEASLDFWRRELAGAPVLELPTDRPRGRVPGAEAGIEDFALSRELTDALETLVRRHGATLFMGITAAFQALLSRYSGQTDLTVGTPVAGRLRTELEPLIGFFVNTLVLRADLAGDPGFGGLLGRTRARVLAAFAHQQVPFEKLVVELNPERSLTQTPLFQAMVSFQNTPGGDLDVPGLSFRPLETGGSGAKFDLTLTLVEAPAGLAGSLEYRSALFDPATIRRMLDHLETLLAGVAKSPGTRLSELPLLPEAELEQVTAEWSGPWAAFPETACLHELFDRQASGAVAVTFEGESLTYGELRARANRVAWRLRGLGVGPESRVGLAAERSLDLIVGLLGILKAGGAYVPVDPSYPEERLAFLLEDSGVPVLLTQAGLAEKLPPYPGHVLLLDGEGFDGEGPESGADPDNAAYVIYTSGSTGKPKGTVVTHRNVARLLASTESRFGFGPGDVWTLFHSYAFDFSVWEIWGALACGGRLVIVPYWVSRSPEAFLSLLEKERVTVLNQTPSAFRQLGAAEADLALRLVIFGGEALEVASLAPWFERHGDETPRLVNMYGITETTVHVTWRPVTRADLAEPYRSPIGPAIPDLSVHLLDRWGNPVPAGVPGEICVGGPGLARGYLARPDLTAERYVPNPFAEGERLYRSGDLARFRPGGEIDYLGRIDHQVKIRGFRIELGEIEAALARHPQVEEVVVLAREEGEDRRLVAYLAAGEAPAAEELRTFLAETLPDYMVPSAFAVLPALPLTSHGKVDRRALLEIRPEAGPASEYVPPRTATEEVLAGLWASVLGIERVGLRDNFFELGGHSLVATRLVARVRQVFGVDVPLRALFEGPTVEELARRVEAGEKGSVPPIVPVPRVGALPLSFAQERLWFLDQFDPGTPTLNIPLAMRLPASVDPEALARALAGVVERHEALRTAFGSEEGRPFQRIGPPFAPPLPVTDLSGLDPEVREREAARLEAEEGLLSFDLARGPLLRARLLRLGDAAVLLLTVHHIVSDGWSMGLLTRELGAAYQGLALPELPVQYADYAVWQRSWLSGETLDAQIAYWREKLAEPPVLDLPTDRPRPAVQTWRGAGLAYTLGPDLTGRLATLARGEGATLFMVLLAAFQALLARLSGQDDVIVGAPVAGRVREETEPLIGCFLNNVALRTDLSGSPSFRELLARARATALEAYGHQDVPFEKLLEELRPNRDLSRTPIFQVFLNMLNFPAEEGAAGGFGDAFTPEVPAKFDLTVYAAESGGALHLDLVYNAGLFDRERVEEMARQLEILLARAAEEPEARIGEVSLVTEAALLPDPAKPPDAGFRGSIHDALARQSPERVAVVEDGKILTYGELQAAASGLAGLLASRGIGRGEVVAVWAHRSAALPGAVLGALRAGAAFMVLDPAYPASRLVDYLHIGQPGAFVAIAGAAPPPPEVEAELAGVLRIELPAELPAGGPSIEAGPEDLAVITFTSGSTGRPKGVAGRHGPLTHFYPWMAERFGLSGDDRFGMLSALSHDPLQRDLFTPVWLGAALCVPDPERIGSPGYLADWVRREGVTVLHLTPAMLELLVQAAEETGVEMPSLRRAFVVGDLLKRSDVERLYTVAPGLTCINLYGSTETQRSVSYFVVPREARACREVLPLGRGMEDAQLLVVNPAGALAGVGELGEIHMRSAHLALGYLGDPGLTAERFLPDGGEVRRYRTGDLGRYLPNGDVEFAGRADAQVKIRGFRIEPGEIEAALARFPGVREGVVIVREDRPGDRRLVAYAVPRPGAEIPPADVRAFLALRLPGYMVPADVAVLPALPLTRTGKIDRRALPAPERTAGEGAVAPRTAAEETLAGLWRELLGVEDVGVEDDFFDRGGHSLLATQLLSRIRTAFGAELPLRALFERPTVAGMAALLAETGAASPVPPLTRYPDRDEAPLSFAQQRLWFLDQLDPGSSAYNMFQALRLEGDLDEAAFEAALREVVRRQESLRTRFVPRGGQAVQVIDPAPAFVAPVADLSALPAGLREREGERIVREEALRPFDLERGPVLRARLLRLGAAERWLVVSMHHIVSDGLSIAIFIHEVSALYAGLPLPPLAVRYTDFARWQRSWLTGEALDREVAWWRERLTGAPPVLALPLDRPRPAVPVVPGGKRSRPLPDTASAGLLRLARSREATPFMAGLALVDALLARHTGEDDLVVGTPVANRGRRELEDLIGFFANTLALRVQVRWDLGFADLLDRVREAALGAYSHQDVPFEKLVEDLSPERSLRHSPIVQVMFVMVAAPLESSAEGPIRMSTLPVEADSVRFDLTLSLVEGPRGLALSAHYNAGLFFAATIERLLDHAAVLLAGLVADPHRPVGDLPLLAPAERSQLLAEWNDTAAPIPPLLFHELFERQVRERPEAVAAVDGREAVSFRDLDARANRLARHLRARGAGPEVRVGLAVDRSVGLVVGLLGILKSGAAWVPLDPSWPQERLDWLLEDSGITLIVTDDTLAESAAGDGRPLPALAADPDRLAYVLYTSGSTGRPKGVAVSHRGIANLAAAQVPLFGLGPKDRFLQLASPSFDASVAEIAMAWWAGAELHLAGRDSLLPGEPLARLLAERRITGFAATPTALAALPPVPLPDLALVIVGGEPCPPDLAGRWAAGRRFINAYGPTEVTVTASVKRHRAGDAITLGRPIANARIHLLDGRFGLVPMGVAGEIAVAGAGLARGYLGRPDLTADRFVPDPWGMPGDRLYRTGDLGRRLPDGEIEFLGRADQQVKVRGVRIEPGEVEAALLRHPSVREAVAGVRRGELVAWMAAPSRPAVAELRRFLSESLPEALVPTAFVFLDELPKTPAGKTDRRSLPDPGRDRVRAEEHVPPSTSEERLLADLWTEVLDVESPGVTESFFDLGGHSLLATQLLSRIRDAFKVEVPLRALFEQPTIRGMAGLLAAGEAPSAPPLVARPHEDDPPLSFAQQRLWFIHQLDPGSAAYNTHQVLRLDGELDEAALAAALRELVRRQAALRTRFTTRGHQAVQVIGPVPEELMPVVDLAALPETLRSNEAERIAREESLRPFDLQRGPVLRVRLLRLAAQERLLAVALHHIVSDGWSLGVFLHEVTHLYAGLPLPPLPVQYADYARWQREWLTGETLEREIDWWRRHLAGAPPVLDLPLDRPRPALQSYHGDRRSLRLPGGASASLLALAHAREATPFMAGFALVAALLARHTGADDLVIGTPIANRNRREIEGVIGFFANTLALRARLRPDRGFATLLDDVRETALGAYTHQDVPFERIVEELAPERNLATTPLFQVVFVMNPAPPPAAETGPLAISVLQVESEEVKFDLVVSIEEGAQGLNLTVRYNSGLFFGATIERLLEHAAILLDGIAADPDRPLAELPVLSEAEWIQVTRAPEAAFPVAASLPERFEEQALRNPSAVAAVFEGTPLTYAELDLRSNRLARHLRRLGVGPEVRVGLAAERSLDLIVGLLAILKAGGAYVPIDPSYPEERLAFLLEDAFQGIDAPVLLTQSPMPFRGHALPLTGGAWEEESGEALPALVGPENAAYVIYTSGSTGRPKGTIVTHANVLRLFASTESGFGFGPEDVWTLFHSYAFDFSVWEIWGALLYGGRLAVVPFWVSRSPGEFLDLLARERVTVLNQTPSAFRQLVAAEEVRGGADLALRCIVFGGEALDLRSLEPWLDRHGDLRPRLVNMYGITETTVHVTWRTITRADLSESFRSPVGVPVPDLSIHLLDAAGQPVPLGVPGEIHVGGAGLARGYLGRPDLTAERYVPNPFAAGERLYRSGDLARLRPDGDLDFLGRIDHQVKVRGFRIELGEIEAALGQHPAVKESVVLLRRDELVAWLGIGGAEPPADLRAFLSGKLPEHMIPAAFVVLPALPLTAHGKVDRRALPDPGAPQPGREAVPPTNAVERFLADLWESVLGISGLGIHDDFFELGGNSIKAAILTNALEERLGEYVFVVALFDAPTIARLAVYLETHYPAAVARITGAEAAAPPTAATRIDEAALARFRSYIHPLPPPGPERAGRPKNPPAVFLLSPPRSGSTLLRVMLGGHPDLFAPPELELLSFETLRERKAAFSGRYSFWTEGTLRALMEIEGCGPGRAREIMESWEERDLSVRDFYRELQKRLGGRLLVDKTPSYALDPNALARAETDFDEPVYIHLARHPYGMIRSFEEARLDQIFFRTEHPFSRRELAELIWTESEKNILEFLARVPAHRQVHVRFEDLVRDPRREMEKICEMLGIDLHPAMLDPYQDSGRRMTDGLHAVSRMLGDVKFHEHQGVDVAAADRWKHEIAEDFLGDVTWSLASFLGYEMPRQRARALVPLAAGGPGTPFFCVHPAGGNVLCYAGLAREIGPDRPFYGLQALGLSGLEPQETVEEMAATYLAEIRAVQPHGPYLLGGWSLGGVVAYEMAQRLRGEGEEVALLALIDAVVPGRLPEEERPPRQEDADFVLQRIVAELEPAAGEALEAEAAKLADLPPDERLEGVLAVAKEAGYLPPGVGAGQVRRMIRVYRTGGAAWWRYRPAPYPGRALLLRALEGPLVQNPSLDWHGLLTGDWETVDVPGTHQALMAEPAVHDVADALRDRLRRSG